MWTKWWKEIRKYDQWNTHSSYGRKNNVINELLFTACGINNNDYNGLK